MSKKKRDDSYFAADRRRKRKYMMIVIPIIVVVAAAGAAAAVMAPRGPNFGALGSAHEHAVFEVSLDGSPIDFSQSKYQVKSQFIHVENGDGTTLHRHSTMVPVGEFFNSIGMALQDSCFIRDDGARFCDGTDGKQLRFFVNGEEQDSVANYILKQDDRILIIYGNETEEQIQSAIQKLKDTPIKA